MKFVSTLSDEEISQLNYVQLYHESPRTRLRATVILLSHSRVPLLQIAQALLLARQTVSTYIDEWEETRNPEMEDLPRSGAPPILSPEDEDLLVKIAKEEPRNQKKVLHLLEEKTGKTISPSTFKNVIKKKKLDLEKNKSQLEIKKKRKRVSGDENDNRSAGKARRQRKS